MARWLALFVLVGSAGCGMMDEWTYDNDPVVYDSRPTVAAQPTCGTGVVPASFNQTQEPPR